MIGSNWANIAFLKDKRKGVPVANDSGFMLLFTVFITAVIFLSTAVCFADSREYRLKASFIEKFVQLTRWPDDVLPPDKNKPFVIAIMGKNPFGKILDIMYRSDKIEGRRVAVRYIFRPEQITGCHLLFISKSMQKYLLSILKTCRRKPILTISEVEGFARKGGHINFYVTDKDTLHFEINETKVKESGLHMHLLLIEIAKIVK